MKLLYVDESGDPGTSTNSPSSYFLLAGLMLDARHWHVVTRELLAFRHQLSWRYGLPVSEEIHASVFLSNRTAIAARISANNRLRILLDCLEWCAASPYLRLLTTGLDKRTHTSLLPFNEVWTSLYSLFDNVLCTAPADNGLVLCDNTDGRSLNQLLYNLRHPPTNSTVQLLRQVIEEPVFRDSHRSFLHQLADVVAYFAKQLLAPSNFIKEKGASAYFHRLLSINELAGRPDCPSGILML